MKCYLNKTSPLTSDEKHTQCLSLCQYDVQLGFNILSTKYPQLHFVHKMSKSTFCLCCVNYVGFKFNILFPKCPHQHSVHKMSTSTFCLTHLTYGHFADPGQNEDKMLIPDWTIYWQIVTIETFYRQIVVK